jgi:NAD(P)-dependent dehydrogenase (short-subunit alcohol dehydrogenase family)
VLTGASRGLGLALARALSARGWSLVLNARGGPALHAAVAELPGPGRAVAIPGDVADPAHRAALIAAAVELGGPDLLVNNASVLGDAPLVPLAQHSLDGFAQALAVNTTAPLGLIQLALPLLRESRLRRDGHGAILNLSSDAAAEAYPTWGGYGASKAALDHLSAVLAEEEKSVRVWAVDPGDMRTALYAAAVPDDDGADRPLPETVVPAFLALLDRDAPSGRYSAPSLLVGVAASPGQR